MYCTYRRSEDDLAAIQGSRLIAAIDAAVDRGASEVTLTGGEPTMRGDLPMLVAHTKRAGARAVLETNATLVDAGLATRLKEAGLSRALVNLAGPSASLDAVTRDPGGFDRTLRGIEALVLAGVDVFVQAAVVRSTQEELSGLPSRLAGLSVSGLVLTVPTESPAAEELLGWEDACKAVIRVETEARRVGLPVQLSADAAPPPCAFPPKARIQHLYSQTPGAGRRDGFRHVPACQACLMREACPGIAESYLAREPSPRMHPITDDRVRRRLSLVSDVAEQTRRELVSRSRTVHPTLGVIEESVIRIHFHCNQSCTFCFVSTHLPPPADEAVLAAIELAARQGSKVVLSGGEPTLSARLADYVGLAKSLSSLPVQIQTNAVKLEDASLVDALAAAGLDEAFVSLHGATASVSDRVTEAPGTFERTLRGIDQLTRARIRVIVNFVLCEPNYREASAFVRLIASRWPAALVNFSFVAPSSDLVPRTPDLIPRYRDVAPDLREAIDLARNRGLEVVGLESMCGLPLCLVPVQVRDLALAEIPEGYDQGEFTKGTACQSCALESRCYGLRRGYAAMYGEGELRAVPSQGARGNVRT